MALIDKASLLMVPSVYEDGTLYNVLPSGNKAPDETGSHNGYDQTRADFTFSRGSNLSATRINSDGLIEKGRENLLLQSNQFDTTWAKTNTTLTSGQSGYDGNSNAWKVEATNGVHRIEQNVSFSGVNTLSVYAKAGNATLLRMQTQTGGTDVFFDLSNGIIDYQEAAAVDAKIEATSVAGWYRCSMTINETGSNIRFLAQSSRYNVSDGDYIFIQSAQLEAGLVATDYIETGSVSGTAGVLENTPRIDYSSGAGALLLEPGRTNVLSNSEYYAGYPQTRITLTHNSTTSPEGFINATKMVETTDNGLHFLAITGSVTSSANAAFSIFAKQGENQFLQVLFGTAQTSPDAYANVDLSNGTYNDYNMVSFDTEDYGNGWYRVFGVVNSLTTSLGFYIASVQSKTAARAETYAGDGASGFYIYGAQMESSASYPSSYVPTYGSAATRGADSCSVTGVSDVIGQTEGTLFLDYETDNAEDNGRLIAIGDGSTSNRILLRNQGSGTLLYVAAGGSSTWSTTYYTPGNTGRIKIALAYANNDGILFVNGSSVNSDTSVTIPTCSNVYIGTSEYGGSESVNMLVHDAVLFNERLTNEELATLTTL